MTINSSHSAALDALEESVNAVLMQTGSVFSNPANFDSWRIIRTNSLLKNSMPGVMSGFHDCLDTLERELIRARAVLHRDLVTARETQALGGFQSHQFPDSLLKNVGPHDVAMVDAPLPITNGAADASQHNMTASAELEPSALPATSELLPHVREPSPAMIVGSIPVASQTHREIQETLDAREIRDEAASVQMIRQESPIGNVEGKDHEGTARNPLDLDEDVPDNSELFMQDDLFGTPSNHEGTPNDSALANVDVNTLLPGLEYYANDNNAEDLEVFPDLAGDQAFDMAKHTDVSQGLLNGQSTMNFEDYFANIGAENGILETQGQGTTTGEDTNFDEDFFNLG